MKPYFLSVCESTRFKFNLNHERKHKHTYKKPFKSQQALNNIKQTLAQIGFFCEAYKGVFFSCKIRWLIIVSENNT